MIRLRLHPLKCALSSALLLLAACTSRPSPPDSVPVARTAAPSSAGELPGFPTPRPVDISTPVVDPLHLTFPTPVPPPVPIWRPPAYDIPWSLRPQDHFWFARPIASDQVNWPFWAYRYGGTYYGKMSVHAGVDIDAPRGTSVLAAGNGTVVWAGWGLLHVRPVEDDPYGLAVAIEHDFGLNGERLYTVYTHLSTTEVWAGQPVVTGQKIGEVGITGNTTGDHLHFEVRLGKNSIRNARNPELWVAPSQGWGVLAGRVLDERSRPIFEKLVTVRAMESGQHWQVWTYGSDLAHSDDFYQENLVLGDLPAGRYSLSLDYAPPTKVKVTYTRTVDLLPGVTTLVLFTPPAGFTLEPSQPPLPLPATSHP